MTSTPLSVRTPEDLLAVIPVLLGFEPTDSVVMLTFGGAETFHARVDLEPRPGEPDDLVPVLLGPAIRHGVEGVVFVLYCEESPRFGAVLRRLRREFGRAGIGVVEVLRAHDGRWFAPGRPGVPAAGVCYDVAGHRFRAQAVLDGVVVHGSRAELEQLLRSVSALAAETRRAVRRAVPSSPGEVTDLVEHRLSEGRFATPELARVLLGIADPDGRGAACARITRETALDHVRLWTDAVQRAPDELAAAPAAVLALTAWLAGHGALAWCAVDRCCEIEPDNTLAGLVADVLARAVSPSAWRAEAG